MLVDSHCHLDFPELSGNLDAVLDVMKQNAVEAALCVAVSLEDFPRVRHFAETLPGIFGSVGVHPDYEGVRDPSVAELVNLAAHPRIVAIGETGLDYYRLRGDLEWQRERFRTHIRAASEIGKPLIIHTRAAAEDTLRIMREERAERAGGVMHCFTENWDTAQAAMDMGFYISMSGIVTFKNARVLHEVARLVPTDRLLVETDSPYLAPVPYRGRTNQPGYVRYVADNIAQRKGLDLIQIAEATTGNFYRLFNIIRDMHDTIH